MTTNIKKSQIIKSINNLHLKGTIDEGFEKNSLPLFSSSTDGAINISEVGLYQIIDSMIKQILKIKNIDKITRRVGVDITKEKYYTTSLNRYSLKNREKQLYDVLQKAPVTSNVNELDLTNNIDGSSSSNLTCQIVYKDGLFTGTDVDNIPVGTETDNLKSNDFISLQTPIKYNTDGNRISGEFKFVLRAALTGGGGAKFYNNITDNCIEFLKETNAETTATNLTNAINSITVFTATINSTSKTITVTQSNTDGIIIDNISFFTLGIQLPIQNFRSFKYTQFFANTISKTLSIRGFNNATDNNRFSLLVVGYNQNGIPVKKYSVDALFEFFGRMTYEFIKLNNNHIGKEKNHPGSYNLDNKDNGIETHHLNSVTNLSINTNTIFKSNVITQLLNIKKKGFFGSIDINQSNSKFLEQYKFIDRNLFDNSLDSQNIPYKEDDPNAIGLYQLINNLIYQLQILKKKIHKREKEFIEILKNSSSSDDIDLDSNKVNNLQAKTTSCSRQGDLDNTKHKPSFVEIINTTDYASPGINYKYSQDALYELCGRWLNELLKLNNGHSGYENIYPGFSTVSNIQNKVSDHHLNSVSEFTPS